MSKTTTVMPRERLEFQVVAGWGYRPSDGDAYGAARERAKALTDDQLQKELKVINLDAQ